MEITKHWTLKEIYNHELLKDISKYLIGSGEGFYAERENLSLEEIKELTPAYNPKDIIYGLERLISLRKEGNTVLYSVYRKEEINTDPSKEDVKFFYFPPKKNSKKQDSFVILCAGGGYGAVASMMEAFPVATKLNEEGYTVFCLDYRTAKKETFNQGLFPKPLDDLAATYRYIEKNAETFRINPQNYIVGGFSAGGHLAGMWGTSHLGFKKYEICAPRILFLVYPLISLHTIGGEMGKLMFTGMLGQDYNYEKMNNYCIDKHVDGTYPPVYLIQCEDDETVNDSNFNYMYEALRKANLVFEGELPKKGGHGFGLGTGTMAEGWVDRALAFIEERGI